VTDLFDSDYPDWKSWLDGNVHEILCPGDRNWLRAALHRRARKYGRYLRTKTVRRDGGMYLRVQTSGPIQ
jgi:hypothetical protein